jgi:L-fucose isomerase-like protein
MPVLPVLPVASELRGHVGPLLEKVRESFAKEAGVELLPQGAEEVAREPLPAILFLTGGTEHEALAFASAAPRPLLLLAHRSHNSLPAALETLARLREEGRKAWIVTENLGEKLSLFSQIAEIARNLNGKRIGWIGGASPWLMASSQASEILAEKLGLKIVTIPLSAVLEALPAEGERPWVRVWPWAKPSGAWLAEYTPP